MLTIIEDFARMPFHPIEWYFAPSVSKLTSDESTRGHGSCIASKAAVSPAFERCQLLFCVSFYTSQLNNQAPCYTSKALTLILPGLVLGRLQKLAPHCHEILSHNSRHPLLLRQRPRRHHFQRTEAQIRHFVSTHVGE